MYTYFISNIIDKNKFKEFCVSCWKEKFGFISLNITNKKLYNKLNYFNIY